jgi:DNA-binding beta-propeller fold protein YncE
MRSPILLSALAVACGASESYTSSESARDAGSWDSTVATTGTFAPGPADSSAPPEVEGDRLRLPPAETDVFVFVANPDYDSVTRINVNTSAVDTTPVGNHPTHVATTADYRTAVVFNEGDDTVSLIDANTLDQTVVRVRDDFNTLALSPDGAWAVLWFDAYAPDDDDDSNADGLQSYNEASFVDVATGAHHPMVVGYRPRQVAFTPDGRLAALVSDDYLAVVDLTVADPSPVLIELEPDLVEPPAAEETVLDPTGTWAFVRQFGTNDVLVVDLPSRAVDHVPVGDNPTDLDLSPDGAEAVVVARGSQELWILDADDPFAPAEVLGLPPDLSAGQILFDPTGDQAVVYTTSTLVDRYATWDLATDVVRERALVKPVGTMSIAPSGDTLLVFHTLEDAVGTDEEFRDSWAVSMIALDSFVASPLKVPAEPEGYVHGTLGDHGYFIMDGEPVLVRMDYDSLLAWEIGLRSNPVFVGVLPDLDAADGDQPRAWVSQDHDLGRISFYDPDDDSLETLTGFELNSGIED